MLKMKIVLISIASALILLSIPAINSQILSNRDTISTVSVSQLNKSLSPNPSPTVTPALESSIGVDSIDLDKGRVHIPC